MNKQPRILKFFTPCASNQDLVLEQIASILTIFCSPFSWAFDLLHGQEKLMEILMCIPQEFYQDKEFCLKILDAFENRAMDVYYHASLPEKDFFAFVEELLKVQTLMPRPLFSLEANCEIFKNFSFLFYCLPEHIRSDRNWIEQLAVHNRRIFLFAQQDVRCDPQFILDLLRKNINVLRFAAESTKGNRNFFLHATQIDYKALKYASMSLRNDPEFVMEVIKVNPFAFKAAASELRHNQAFVAQAYQLDSRSLFGACSQLKKFFTGANFIETVTHERVVVTEHIQKLTLK
jgi:hypothetical protein